MSSRSSSGPDTADPTGSFDEIADDLYGSPPEEFTATRTQQEKQAKDAGDGELAARIRGLRKPNAAAWLANQLARERRDELSALRELGAGLRAATKNLAGDELRQLSRQQHELVRAMVQQARQLAQTSGRTVSDSAARGLEDTLYAALADESAAEQLVAGRLTEPLNRSGFGGAAAAGPGSATPERLKPVGKRKADGGEQLRQAEDEVSEAERALTTATRARDDAQTRSADADEAAQAAHDEVEQLRRQLDSASKAAADAERDRRERATALRRAERSVSEAELRHVDAEKRRDRLARDN